MSEAFQAYLSVALFHGFVLGIMDLMNAGPSAELEDMPYGVVWAVLRGAFWPLVWLYVAWTGLRRWWSTGDFWPPRK